MDDFDWSKDDVYLSRWYDFFQMNNLRYVKTLDMHLEFLQGADSILDLGAGTGLFARRYLVKGNSSTPIVNIDISSIALKVLDEECSKYAENKVSTLEADLGEINDDMFYEHRRRYTGANSLIALTFVKNFRRSIDFVSSSLKENGRFVITSWAPEEDIWYGVIGLNEEEFKRNGVLPTYKSEWEKQKEGTHKMAEMIINSGLTSDILGDILQDRFQKVRRIENGYEKYALTYQAENPK